MLGYYTDIIAPIDPINLKFLKGCALLIICAFVLVHCHWAWNSFPWFLSSQADQMARIEREGGGAQFCWVARHGGPFSLSGPFCCCLPKLHCKKGTKYSPVLHY